MRQRRAANRWPTWGTAYPQPDFQIQEPGWAAYYSSGPLSLSATPFAQGLRAHLSLSFIGANSMTELDASAALTPVSPAPDGQSPRGVFPRGMLLRGLRGFLTDSMEEASWNRAFAG